MDEALLDSIYETVLRPEAWDDVLRLLADGMGAEGGAVVWQDLLTNAAKGIFSRTDPEAIRLYSTYFATHNPLRPTAGEVRRALPTWRPDVILDEHRLPKSVFLGTEFYNDFFRPFGFHASAAIGLEVVGLEGATLDILKSRRAGDFTADQLALARRAQPHLGRAFRAAREVAAARAAPSPSEESVFEAWRHGAMIVDVDRRVLYMNPAAEALARGGVAVRVIEGVLTLVHRGAAERLDALVRSAVARNPRDRAGGFLAAPGGPDRLPLTLSITPLRAEAHPLFSTPSVLITMRDPAREVAITPERLREAFGLTATEIKVALSLFGGKATGEVAEQFGISMNTVRNHLARILEKTHSSGQAELSRKLMSLA